MASEPNRSTRAEGGSIPIIRDLKEVAGLESLMIGLFTNEDNLHAPTKAFTWGLEKASIIRDVAETAQGET